MLDNLADDEEGLDVVVGQKGIPVGQTVLAGMSRLDLVRLVEVVQGGAGNVDSAAMTTTTTILEFFFLFSK